MGYSPEDTLFDVLFANDYYRSFRWPDPIGAGFHNTEAEGDKRNVIGQDGKPWKGYGFFIQKAMWEEYRNLELVELTITLRLMFTTKLEVYDGR